jgi:glycosyltransferase involved in cell wall biosynthesis
MFDRENNERKRMELCAAEVTELHMIIFTLQSDNLSVIEGEYGLKIHPTNSKNKLMMIFDAFRITSQIISGSSQKVIVTTQDSFEAGLVGYFLQRRFRVHLTVQEHADVFEQNYWRKESFLNQIRYRIGLFVLKRADTVRTVSDRITKKMKRMKLKANLTQLPVAIDPASFISQPQPGHNDSDTFTFLTMARFVKQKNLTLLLNAFFKVWQVCPHARLVIVGRGPEAERLKFIVQDQYNEQVPVRFIDWSDNPSELFADSDAYVLSSNYEGWGRVLVEAMLMRVPVVTTDVGCVGEVLINGEHGLSVPVNNETALAQAMTEMAVNREKYLKIKANLNSLDINSLKGLSIETYGKKWAQSLT